jgi:hypothetical protein
MPRGCTKVLYAAFVLYEGKRLIFTSHKTFSSASSSQNRSTVKNWEIWGLNIAGIPNHFRIRFLEGGKIKVDSIETVGSLNATLPT